MTRGSQEKYDLENGRSVRLENRHAKVHYKGQPLNPILNERMSSLSRPYVLHTAQGADAQGADANASGKEATAALQSITDARRAIETAAEASAQDGALENFQNPVLVTKAVSRTNYQSTARGRRARGKCQRKWQTM